MKLLSDLFSTDYGLMSIIGIIIVIAIGVFFFLYLKRKMAEDSLAADIKQASDLVKQRKLDSGAPQ
ncbi:MAG: DUF3149 domain-containing protein [Burkholderiaceae bacterium]